MEKVKPPSIAWSIEKENPPIWARNGVIRSNILSKQLDAKLSKEDLIVPQVYRRRFSTTPNHDMNKNIWHHVHLAAFTETSYYTNLYERTQVLGDYFHELKKMVIWERLCTTISIWNGMETTKSLQHFVAHFRSSVLHFFEMLYKICTKLNIS